MTTDSTATAPDTTDWKQTPDGIAIPPLSPDDVLYESLDGFGRITLNRPIVLNAVNKNVQRRLDGGARPRRGGRAGEGDHPHRRGARLLRRWRHVVLALPRR